MSKTYVIRPGDSLGRIARVHMGATDLADELAQFNGIIDPNRIFAGQRIEIPTREELGLGAPGKGPAPAAPAAAPAPSPVPAPLAPVVPVAPVAGLQPPRGLEAVVATFGNLFDYLRDDGTLDPRWEVEKIAYAALPFPIPLSWDHSKSVSRIRVHRLVVPAVEAVFRRLAAEGLQESVDTYGGAYQFRPKRNSNKLSTHSWGIALDLNPETNAMGTPGDMNPAIVEAFEAAGFTWGGRWRGKSCDPMHFQFCSGY